MIISSKDNEQIKEIRKLKEKKYRKEKNKFIIEGINLVQEAILENANIHEIVVCEDCNNEESLNKNLLYEIAKYNCIYVTESVFKSISSVENPQGILAIVEKNIKEKINYDEDVIIILDNIQDPGNLGTIIRTIDSCNLSQVIVSNTSVDCYNTKVVRATMGAIFRVNVIESEDLIKTIKEIKKHKLSIAITSLKEAESIYDVNYKKIAIVMGNESNGVSKEIQDIADKRIRIPMKGKTESLNVAVATGIILYEYVRRNI